MNLSSSRKAVAAGFFAVAALGMAACSPPGQVDSAQKVDTATSQNAGSLNGGATQSSEGKPTNVAEASSASASASTSASPVPAGTLPVLRNCGESSQTKPARIVLACGDQDDFMDNIVWQDWGTDLATGTGTRITVSPDRREEDTKIVLGNPEMIDGEMQFTTVTVDGTKINPESRDR
ncbi:hypothetical protein [Corynebacterium sp. UBA2622]|uniref:hypothetical protein n=1 Tax=Corynebacterium sp. UBA2622 TaxID=1946393 RepID=UPI0025C5F901|nr:hypothetical protein [Corynebacterium sp. UBA2622]